MAETITTQDTVLMTKVPADPPLMIAWEAWKKTVPFENARRWAGGGQHVEGSLWAAFDHGFLAASLMPHPTPPGGPVANPAGEAVYQALVARSLAEIPEEDRAPSSLEDAVRFIERWMPESLPASDTGQIPFGRALLEMALDSMKAALAKGGAPVAESPFTAADLAECAEREVRQRQRAYPRWVEAGRMTQQLADRQTEMMQAIARKLRTEANAENAKSDLFGAKAHHG